jgi:nicotinamidase-related amidase
MRVLAIIDVQRGFINEGTRHIPDIVERLQIPFERICVSRFENAPGSPFRALMGLERFAAGSADCELAFVPRADAKTYVKHGYSAVSDSLMDAGRQAGGAVHLCGIATDNCVLATALDLFTAGLRPVVIADACASHAGVKYHEAGLMILKRLIGEGQVATRAALGL